jgi:hypothetical protein
VARTTISKPSLDRGQQGPVWPALFGRAGPLSREGPTTDIIGALDTVNSLYEEPFFSCRQVGGSPPPAATGSPFPIRAVSEKHLHAEPSLVRLTGRWSNVPLASRPSGNRLGRFRPMLARGDSRMVCCPAGSSLSHSCHLKLCKCGKLFQVLIFLPFLHSARRICSQLYRICSQL